MAQTVEFVREVGLLSEGVRLICIDVLIIAHCQRRNRLWIKL